ncbi:MAG: LacI family DNA-binding transcriptional regulator [Coprococcus sp.]
MNSRQNDKTTYTIDDIAKELGVSKTTVSRAISGKGRIGTETRQKVLDFIEEHNFRPNAVAKSLAQNKTFNIGLVLPNNHNMDNFSFFQQCMNGICAVASHHDYDILIAMSGDRSTRQLERILDNHKVDGIIVTRSVMGSADVALLKSKDIPFIIIGYAPEPDMLYVDNDNQTACTELTSILIENGTRRFALLGGDESYYVSRSRLQGYKDAHIQNKLPVNEDLIFMNMNDNTDISAAIDKILQQETECVICMDDVICSLALSQLLDRGIRIPQDIQIASYYDSNILARSVPSVTSLHFDARSLGAAACSLLLEVLNNQDVQGGTVPGYDICFRESTI